MSEKTIVELRNFYSDYHKDLFGFRPSKIILTLTRDELLEVISDLNAHFFRLESTPQGRKILRDEGWIVPD